MCKSVLVLPLLFTTGLFAQTATAITTVESIPYRAILSSINETQQPPSPAAGAATVWLHLVRDSKGVVVSGSADANVSYNFPTAGAATAMHIHKAPAGVDGAIVLPFTLSRTDVSGAGTFAPAQTNFPSSAVTLDTINGILADPTQFYFNVHSADAPAGVMRGQLQRTEAIVRLGRMIPENETPPIGGQTWNGVGAFELLVTRDANNAVTSAYAIFDLAYQGFPAGTTFTGFHIHTGGAQVAGPVTINSGLRGPVAVGANGTGSLHYETEVDLSGAGALNAVNGVISNPSGFYINAHTADAPSGAIRSQLQTADKMDFTMILSPDQEVPPITGFAGLAPSRVTVYTMRASDGSVTGGAVIFDENVQFPAGSTITATHIHDGVAGVNGPVIIDSRLRNTPVLVNDGTGNIYRLVTVADTAGIATLNSIVTTPWKQYLNIHTADHPGGAVRAQLVPASTTLPAITSVQAAVPFASLTTLAPGSNFVINGTSLGFIGTDLSGFSNPLVLPTTLNGVSVTVGGSPVPLSFVGPNQIGGQIPFNVTAGQQPVVVTSTNGASKSFMVTIASAAPAVQYGPNGVVATRQSDNKAITSTNAATAGDVVIVTATGLGQTTPALVTGNVVTAPYPVNTDVNARIGGVNTTVLYAKALPGMPGLYQVAILVPPGIPAGNAPLLLQIGLITSNVVALPVK
jgi:uncharacterized protein (TIGR03437 family)